MPHFHSVQLTWITSQLNKAKVFDCDKLNRTACFCKKAGGGTVVITPSTGIAIIILELGKERCLTLLGKYDGLHARWERDLYGPEKWGEKMI